MNSICLTADKNVFLAFLSAPLWVISTLGIILILCIVFIGWRINKRDWATWWAASVWELKSTKVLLLFLGFEASLMVVAAFPYALFGTHDEIIGYLTFALPCLAALLAGAGLAGGRGRLDPNGWAYIGSAVLLLAAFLIFIYQPKFANQIAFLSLPVLVMDATVALGMMNARTAGKFTLTNYYLPFVIGLGVLAAVLGFLFYGFVFRKC